MKKALIIGSKGFIGSHLFNHLVQNKTNEVWGCDVVNDYNAKNYFVIDAGNSNFEEIFQTQKFDTCINCSGSASVPDSILHPLRDYYLNAVNVFKLLEAIRRHAPNCKFLNLSSAAVYGNPEILPVLETQVLRPLSPYGWNKLQSEVLCKEYYEVFGIRTCSIRIFSAFGIGLQKQIFWDWYQKAQISHNICLIGTGKESRDFIYIEDLVQAIHCVVTNGSFEADIINVANGEEIFINEAAEVFSENMKGRFNYYFSNTVRTGDPLNWMADITKLTALGYKKKVDFAKGISRYITWLEGVK